MTFLRPLIPALLLVANAAVAAPVFSTGDGAIRGYDPVAYFTEQKPVKGSADYTAEYEGATWRFSSAANRDLFVADPLRYAPQYGGHCAFAMTSGNLASTDPEAWYIHEGKLYLNYSKGIQKRWLRDVPGNIAKADGQWAEKHVD